MRRSQSGMKESGLSSSAGLDTHIDISPLARGRFEPPTGLGCDAASHLSKDSVSGDPGGEPVRGFMMWGAHTFIHVYIIPRRIPVYTFTHFIPCLLHTCIWPRYKISPRYLDSPREKPLLPRRSSATRSPRDMATRTSNSSS